MQRLKIEKFQNKKSAESYNKSTSVFYQFFMTFVFLFSRGREEHYRSFFPIQIARVMNACQIMECYAANCLQDRMIG